MSNAERPTHLLAMSIQVGHNVSAKYWKHARTWQCSGSCALQDMVLFNDTIRYNIEYGRLGAGKAEVYAAARRVSQSILQAVHLLTCSHAAANQDTSPLQVTDNTA